MRRLDPQPGPAEPGEEGPLAPRLPARRWARRVVAGAFVLLGIFILWDFLPALVWAGVFAIATWPLYMRLVAAVPARAASVIAPLAATLAIGLVFVIPLIVATVEVAHEARAVVDWAAAAQKTGLPAPGWVAELPGIGEAAAAWWRANLGDPGAAAEFLGRANRSVFGEWTRALGIKLLHGVTVFAFTLLTLFFIYSNGTALIAQFRIVGERLLGPRSERLARTAIAAVYGAVNGLVLVGLGEGILLGAAYAAVGVPQAALLGALTGIFAMIPFGAPLVFGAAALGLLAEGARAAAFGLLAFGAVVVFIADHFVRPVLVGGAARLPFLWVLLGILGGIESLGLLGLFVGPAVMAVLMSLWRDWTEAPLPADADGPPGGG